VEDSDDGDAEEPVEPVDLEPNVEVKVNGKSKAKGEGSTKANTAKEKK
jgi:hypothetical protein